MKKDEMHLENKKRFLESRAVIAGAIAVTAFLCFFTAFEILTIKMEWNLPFMSVFIGGSDSYIFSQYRKEEEKLEMSTENEIEPVMVTEAAEDIDVSTSAETEQDEVTPDTELVPETEACDELPYYIKINRQQNVITVYKKDDSGQYAIPVRAILCSTGMYNATPKGVFQLSSKYLWRELNGGVYGQYASRITGGVLFHSVPYASKDKSTLYWEKYNKLGQQASMGCVRLTVEDAKWIYDNCPSGTSVEVYDSDDPGPLGKPEAIKLDKDNANRGWDPTDPDENNPWHGWSGDE